MWKKISAGVFLAFIALSQISYYPPVSGGGGGGSVVAGTGINVVGSTVSIDTAVTASRDIAASGIDTFCSDSTGSTTTKTCDLTANAGPSSSTGKALVAYTEGMMIRLRSTSGVSGTPTLNINGLGARNLYEADGTTLMSSYTAGQDQPMTYQASLNGGAGGWKKVVGGATQSPINAAFYPTGPTMSAASFSVGSANRVFYFPFQAQAPLLVRNFKSSTFHTSPADTIGYGIYDSACNLVAGTTASSTPGGSNTNFRARMSATVTLQPGMYYVGFTTVNTGNVYAATGVFDSAMRNAGESGSSLVVFYGSNSSSAGVVPSSCGTKTAHTGGDIPAIWVDNQ